MGGVLRAELRKLSSMSWSWLAVVGMNAFSAAMFLLFVLVWLRSTALDDAARASVDMARQAGGILSFVFLTETWAFSVLGVFFLGLLVGELVGRELAEGSAALTVLSPASRTQILLAKLAAVLVVYAMALALSLSLQGATVLILSRVHPIFLSVIDVGVLARILAAHVLIDLSWVALLFLFSTLSSGSASTLAYTMGFWVASLTADAAVFLGTHFSFLGPWTAAAGRYTFTATCRVLETGQLRRYLFETDAPFPLSLELLGVNFLYALLFFGLALTVFRRRDI